MLCRMRSGMVRLLCVALVGSAVAVTQLAPAHANHASPWHWRHGAGPLEVRLVDSVNVTWQAAVNRAAREWTDRVSNVDFVKVTGKSDLYTRQRCPGVPGKARVCNADYGAVDWAGLTILTIDANNHIKHVRVKLNDHWGRGAYRAIACHE